MSGGRDCEATDPEKVPVLYDKPMEDYSVIGIIEGHGRGVAGQSKGSAHPQA